MDDKAKRQIRALLERAEHPATGEQEREVSMAKAMELMAKHGITEAAAQAGRPTVVATRSIALPARYRIDMMTLVNAVAVSLRCMSIAHYRRSSGRRVLTDCTIYGAAADADRVVMLADSLMAQAGQQVTLVFPGGRTTPPETANFRRSWLRGFTLAVQERLRVIEEEAVADAEPGVALVLSGRAKAVHDAVMAVSDVKMKLPPRTRSGREMGYQAGQRASINYGEVNA